MNKTPEELRAGLEAMRALYRRASVAVPHSMPQIKGIFLGGCVAKGVGSSFRAQAHAHNHKDDPHCGWVCFRSIKRLGKYEMVEQDDGTALITISKPGSTLIHEWAHILVPNQGHTDRWRAKMRELGQKIKPHHQKKAKLVTPLPVRKTMCATCPFRPDGWTEVRPLLEGRAMYSTPICHSTGKALTRHDGEKLKAHACRGARNQQLAFFHGIGFLAEATDAAWAAKWEELQAKKKQN